MTLEPITYETETGLKVTSFSRAMRNNELVILCCICFEYFATDELYVDHDDQKWDYCWGCAMHEHPTIMTWPG